jgi:hypothetical protein
VSRSHVRAALRAARAFLPAIAIAAALGFPGAIPVAAHGELILQLGSERVAPGGVVEVRGDLGMGNTVQIVLISKADGSRRLIATLADFEEGHFQQYVTIPPDVAAGDYLVEAGTDVVTVRAPLAIVGSAPVEGGDRPDQGEPLIVPNPTAGVGGALATQAAGAPLGGVVVGTPVREAWPLPPIGIAVVAVFAAIALLAGLRLAGRGRSRAG